jgi:hypothetical protein
MALYTTSGPCNRAYAANRLPNPDPLLMDYAARTIERRYNVSPGMARIVAEMVSTSLVEVRR